MDLERRLAHEMLAVHPQDATLVLEGLPLQDAVGVLGHARPESAAQVLEWGAPHFSAAVLEALESSAAGEVIERLAPEVAAGLLRRMEQSTRAAVLAGVSTRRARALGQLLRFPSGTAGALMDTRALGITDDLTVGEALERLRQDPDGVLFNVYVLDRSDRLVGVSNLRDLVTADPGDPVATRMTRDVSALPAQAGTAAILGHPAWHELHSLPVVDERGALLGAIRYRTYRRLEAEALRAAGDPQAATARALGELLSAGLGGIMDAMTSDRRPDPDAGDSAGG